MPSSPMSLFRVSRLLAAAVLALSAVLAAPIPAQAAATDYYIDAVAGNDAASGTSPATAWRSLAPATGRTFVPGDRVLLARGGTWTGQLAPRGSGTASAPITIGAYGAGNAPRIDGASLSGGAVVALENQSNWVIEGLDIVSNSGVDNFGTLTTNGTPRAGIQVRNTIVNSTVSGIVIRNNRVSDVNGCFHCTGIDAHVNGGIVVDTTVLSANLDGVLIENNTVERVGRTGIVVWDASYYTTSQTVVVASALSTGVRIRSNTVINPDSDGILAFGTDGAVLEHNVVRGAGQRTIPGSSMSAAAGLWPTRAMNTIVQFNEVSGTKLNGTDGQGFDVDLGSTNTRVQYNYSHDNEGGFLLLMGGYSSDVIVRYNLSVNDAWNGEKGVFTFSWGVPNRTSIYNNTIVIPPGSHAKPIHCDGDAGACGPATPGQWWFTNNIVDNRGTGDYVYPGAGGAATFAANVFAGNHPANQPSDATAILADASFVNPGASGSGFAVAAAYQLLPSSPAIANGQVVAGNGGRDFFGSAVSATRQPSRGFHEARPSASTPLLIDEADSWLVASARSSNMVIDTTGPLSNMAGDPSRFKRSDGGSGWVRWEASAGATVMINAYLFGQQSSVVTIVARTAAGATTNVPVSASAAVPTTNGWVARTLTSSALPPGTASVEVRIGAVTAWAVQLGRLTIG